MDFWEYKIVYTDFEFVDERRLNAFGDERWELLSMAAVPNERFQFVFRRPQWKTPPPLAETMDMPLPYTGDTIDITPPFILETTESLPAFSLPASLPAPPPSPEALDDSETDSSEEPTDSTRPLLEQTPDSLRAVDAKRGTPDGDEITKPDGEEPRR